MAEPSAQHLEPYQPGSTESFDLDKIDEILDGLQEPLQSDGQTAQPQEATEQQQQLQNLTLDEQLPRAIHGTYRGTTRRSSAKGLTAGGAKGRGLAQTCALCQGSTGKKQVRLIFCA